MYDIDTYDMYDMFIKKVESLFYILIISITLTD